MVKVSLLQSTLNNSTDCAELWQMFFNFKICKHMHLGRDDMNQTYTMKKGQELIPIEIVDSEKDLGVIIS